MHYWDSSMALGRCQLWWHHEWVCKVVHWSMVLGNKLLRNKHSLTCLWYKLGCRYYDFKWCLCGPFYTIHGNIPCRFVVLSAVRNLLRHVHRNRLEVPHAQMFKIYVVVETNVLGLDFLSFWSPRNRYISAISLYSHNIVSGYYFKKKKKKNPTQYSKQGTQ